MLPQLEIVGVCCGPRLPHEYELVLRTVERAHSGVGLVPDTDVLELAVDRTAASQHLPGMPPVHADLVDRTVDGVLGETTEDRLQECREFCLAHLAGAHREF